MSPAFTHTFQDLNDKFAIANARRDGLLTKSFNSVKPADREYYRSQAKLVANEIARLKVEIDFMQKILGRR
jgi:hypothetical protein